MEIKSMAGGDGYEFPRFDLVSDDSDHHFKQTNRVTGDCFTNASNAVYKKIMHEWKILGRDLPPSISVRVYEQRIDLLRAAIVGAAGTPYHDGLFFFDFIFPSDYPNKPPKVYYHSFGYRLNPNLYANGKVCLSLLNTWNGKHRHERWDPTKSTVLQILVSIQGLVLNEKPYFNEPAYRGFAGMKSYEEASKKYNMNVFVMSCNCMMLLMNKKPKNFEALVSEHFKGRARGVLDACRAYRNEEVRVGMYGKERIGTGGGVTKEFKASVETAYPKLVSYFNWIGAGLEEADKVLIIKPTQPVACKIQRKKSGGGSGIVRKLVAQINKFIGIGNKSKKQEVGN